MDADDSLVGHQVDLGAGVTTVRIRVISPDSRATHTYTIVDLVGRYDANDDGAIDRDEVLDAIDDYFDYDDRITKDEVLEILGLYLFSAPPTPTAREDATAHLAEIIPWFENPPDSIHSLAAETLTWIWLRDTDLGEAVARLPWVTDGVSDFERSSLEALAATAESDLETAKSALSMTLAERDLKLAMLVASSGWFVDGVDMEYPYLSEWIAFRALSDIAETSVELARAVSRLLWIADDMTVKESRVLESLSVIAGDDLELAILTAGLPWIADGIIGREAFLLSRLSYMSRWNPELARLVTSFSVGTPVQDRDIYLISSLQCLHQHESVERLIVQSWFTDGLSAEERAFITALCAAQIEWYDDLFDSHFTQSATISLPLAGEVTLWAFQHAPFPKGQDLLLMIEEAMQGAERFMGVTFPTNDVIVLSIKEDGNNGIQGFLGHRAVQEGDRIKVWWSEDVPVTRELIYHEIGHYYFPSGIGPYWLVEGGAEFVEVYVNDWLGRENLEDRLIESAEIAQYGCGGIPNIHESSTRWDSVCSYILGLHFLLSLFETLGEEAMSSALRELHLWSQHHELRPTEKEIYRTFLKHTPPGLEDEFRDLYRRLHGGPFVVDAED